MELTLIRGLPGAGKSTYASTKYDPLTTRHVEADMFFVEKTNYQFDRGLLGVAHDWCFANAVWYLKQKYDVVVTNTFTMLWELEKYLTIPLLLYHLPINITVIDLKTQFQSIHGIPDEIFLNMKSRWEEIPEDWDVNHIIVPEA